MKNRSKFDEFREKFDKSLPEDQGALAVRLSGKQPTVDIAGHTFFVDLHWNLLRPEDDFTTTGISFPDIDYCYNDEVGKYQFPYNPATHQACEIDFTTLIELPKDIILVEIPPEKELDPVGYARKHDLDPEDILKEHPAREHFQARIIPWKETPVQEIITDNLRKADKKVRQRKPGRRM